jgi:hypothetical protein
MFLLLGKVVESELISVESPADGIINKPLFNGFVFIALFLPIIQLSINV